MRSLGGGKGTYEMLLFFQCRNIFFEHAQTLGTALNRGAQTDARGSCLSQVLDRGALAAARDFVTCASEVLDRGTEAVFRGAALPASCPQRQGKTRGDVSSTRWGRWT
jgi:hypothetical protein